MTIDGMTIAQWANELNCSESTIKRMVKRGDALTKRNRKRGKVVYDGLTARELAEKLECSLPTIYRRLANGTLYSTTEGAKSTSPLTDHRAVSQDWRSAASEIADLPANQFASCWPAIVVEAAHDSGLHGLAQCLIAVRERYRDTYAQRSKRP